MNELFAFTKSQLTGGFFICFLILFIVSVWNGSDAFRQKNKICCVLSSLSAAVSFFFEIEVMSRTSFFSGRYVLLHSAFLILLLLITIFLTLQNVNTKKKRITPAYVKQFGDKLPVGICYWYDGGRILYFNTCMESICIELTGEVLMNGDDFYKLVGKDSVQVAGEKTYRFTHTVLSIDSRNLNELLAFDVTDIRLKNEELLQANREIEELNNELRQYNINMEDTIREQEILQTKINVHDEMNKLLLLSGYSVSENDTEEKRRVLEMWKSSSVLMRGEIMELSSKMIRSEIDELGTMLGLHILWDGELTDNMPEEIRSVFARAAREVIANAVKHGEATELEIAISDKQENLIFTFTNNGKAGSCEISVYGGLLSLRNTVTSLGGSLEISSDENFRIRIVFEKSAVRQM